MPTGRWEKMQAIFDSAVALAGEERRAYIERVCGHDAQLLTEVAAMLECVADEHALAIEGRLLNNAPADVPDRLPGETLGPYRIVRLLGRGGMGIVYLGERADGQFTQHVAIKLVGHGRVWPEMAARVRTERQVLAHLEHPNIARLLDAGVMRDGTPYLVMEFVEGEDITRYCDARSLPLDDRLRLFRIVCDAVQHAHRNLVVHRDLKPSNVMVTRDGTVKLLDFGIAKLLEPSALGLSAATTREGLQLMTPEYAAPEQVLGTPVTTATDVYALGIVLYELLTGVRLRDLEGRTPADIERQITTTTITAPSEVVSKTATREKGQATGDKGRRLARRLRGDLDRIVLMALRPEPERRYASAGQLAEEIGRFLDGRPVLAQPDTFAYRTRRFVGRNRAGVAAAALVALAVTGFGGITAWQARAVARERDAARIERDKSEQVVQVLVDLFETTNPSVRPDGDRMTVGEFLTGSEQHALQGLEGQPAVRARLRQVLGTIYVSRSQFEKGRDALELALKEQRQLLGSDAPETIETMHALGEALYELGRIAEARQIFEESLERTRRRYGEEHEKTGRALHALGMVAADIDESGALLRRALDVRRRALPPNHPDVATTLGELARYFVSRGDIAQARSLYAQAVSMVRDPTQRRYPRSITVMTNYANLLARVNALAEAEQVDREALAIAREVIGPDSFFVADLSNDLAVTLALQRRYPEAERMFHDSFDRHMRLFGESHWRTANVARDVGRVLALQERYAEGLPWMDRAIAIQEKVVASRAPQSGSIRETLLSMRAQRIMMSLWLGRTAGAVAALRAEVEELEKSRNVEAPMVLGDVRTWLARALNETGRAQEAEGVARQALAYFDPLGPGSPRRAEAECELGRAIVLSGRAAEGRAVLDRCLPIYRDWGQAERGVAESFEQLLGGRAAPARGPERTAPAAGRVAR